MMAPDINAKATQSQKSNLRKRKNSNLEKEEESRQIMTNFVRKI